MKITVETIPHHEQRYDTCGDWVLDNDKKAMIVHVSELGNWRYEFLVALHEMIEAMLCFDRGITAEEVDKFDQGYEEARDVDDTSEAGDDPLAPYRDEHFFATSLERLMASELGVDWLAYEDEINKLGY